MTNDDVIEIIKKLNLIFRYDYFEIASENSDGIMIDDLTNFANLVAAAEREACAKLCKEITALNPLFLLHEAYQAGTIDCAEAIQARGNNDV